MTALVLSQSSFSFGTSSGSHSDSKKLPDTNQTLNIQKVLTRNDVVLLKGAGHFRLFNNRVCLEHDVMHISTLPAKRIDDKLRPAQHIFLNSLT